MGLIEQLFLGTVVLGLCALTHVTLLAAGLPLLMKLADAVRERGDVFGAAVLISAGFGITVVAHTLQVWLWAVSLLLMQAAPDLEEALYFSLVTYTTLGYGDIVPGQEIRMYFTLAAVTGLLTFGLSTAFLVGLITRVLSKYTEAAEERAHHKDMS